MFFIKEKFTTFATQNKRKIKKKKYIRQTNAHFNHQTENVETNTASDQECQQPMVVKF